MECPNCHDCVTFWMFLHVCYYFLIFSHVQIFSNVQWGEVWQLLPIKKVDKRLPMESLPWYSSCIDELRSNSDIQLKVWPKKLSLFLWSVGVVQLFYQDGNFQILDEQGWSSQKLDLAFTFPFSYYWASSSPMAPSRTGSCMGTLSSINLHCPPSYQFYQHHHHHHRSLV